MRKNLKKCLLIFCAISLGIVFNNLMLAINNIDDINNDLKNTATNIEKMYVEETIRATQRDSLSSIKQAYVKYVEKHQNWSSIDDEKIIKDEAKDALDIIGSTFNIYGDNGGIIAFETLTGDILLNTSPIDIKNNIYKEYPDEKILSHTDSTEKTKLTFDKTNKIFSIELNDFNKYPIGSKSRLFVEKMILPFEHIGFNNSESKITLLSIVSEEDVEKDILKITNSLESETTRNKNAAKSIYSQVLIAIIAVLSSSVIIIFNEK